ncbi:MAG: hypothetical protein HYZ28_20155 [Myxococcales bacterium]|nr:hypothetical protein [Myxococcales bacterium]
MPRATEVELAVSGRLLRITNPGKLFFPERGITKLDLVRYYLEVSDGALRGVRGRPMALKRYPEGAAGHFFFQKRAPEPRPDWLQTVRLTFPSGRTADELRVDLDPTPGLPFAAVREVALLVREELSQHGLISYPKTSGSRGIHIYAWEEVLTVELADLTISTVPARFRQGGDPSASIDEASFSLEGLLEIAARHEREGLGEAPWPPHFARQPGEPPRVRPSRRRR